MRPIPPELAEQFDRVRDHVNDLELTALLERMADRYDEADSGEAMIAMKLHRGKHLEFRWNGDVRVRPRPKGGR